MSGGGKSRHGLLSCVKINSSLRRGQLLFLKGQDVILLSKNLSIAQRSRRDIYFIFSVHCCSIGHDITVGFSSLYGGIAHTQSLLAEMQVNWRVPREGCYYRKNLGFQVIYGPKYPSWIFGWTSKEFRYREHWHLNPKIVYRFGMNRTRAVGLFLFKTQNRWICLEFTVMRIWIIICLYQPRRWLL